MVDNRIWTVRGKEVIWQPVLRDLRQVDLVVVEEAAKLPLNFLLMELQRLRGFPKVALWGHARLSRTGQNRSAHGSRHVVSLRKHLSRRCHWWFAYTNGTEQRLIASGFPQGRISVVNNTLDIEQLQMWANSLSPRALETVAHEIGLTGGHRGLFASSLYEAKRPEFVLEVAHHVRQTLSDFELIAIGDGPLRQLYESAARDALWIKYLGRTDGPRKSALFRLADVSLLPFSAGLGVLDSFAFGTPIVIVDGDTHGPEVEYIDPGVNGLILPEGSESTEVANAIVSLLQDEDRLRKMKLAAIETAGRYPLSAMVDRFATGIQRALATPLGGKS